MLNNIIQIIDDQSYSIVNNKVDKSLQFNLPINYIEDKYKLQENVITDLELLSDTTHDSLYNYILNPQSSDAQKIIPLWTEYYTTNQSFLVDTQHLLKNFEPINVMIVDHISHLLYYFL